MQQRCPVHHALLSVSDKTDTVEFAQALSARGVELLSTGDAARLLAEKGLPITGVSDYTSFPEVMDGHVKTLHPKVHGGVLGRHGRDDTIVEEHQIQPIDMVIINLYPFAQTVACEGCSLEDVVENIDIGGPTVVCSIAKNHKGAAIMVKSSDYDVIIKEMDGNGGLLTLTTRFDLAIRAFEHIAAYDSMVANYFGSMVPAYHGESKEATGRFPRTLNPNFIEKQDMHCGENSHQQVTFYIERDMKEASIATTAQIQGKAPSYNNIVDIDTALECVREFAEPACVIVKHTNPCGVAIDNSILDAYDRTYKIDPTSALDDIITFNHELDAKTTQAIISRQFAEVIIVPSASEETLKIIAAKQNIRVPTCGQWGEHIPGLDFRRANGGLLAQDRDLRVAGAEELRAVTQRQPTEQELHDALFCWKVAKLMKSNTIVYVKNNMTIGIGAGQMSRVYSAKTAGVKAANEGLEVKGSSVASNAFFPLHDGIDAAAAASVTCVTRPSGSICNDEVITAADRHDTTMLFTDMRHFRHQWSNR